MTNIDNLLPGATQATADLDGDLVAGLFKCQSKLSNPFFSFFLDLFLTINDNNKPKFRIYRLPISDMTLITEYDPPGNMTMYHLSTFADIGKNERARSIFNKKQ